MDYFNSYSVRCQSSSPKHDYCVLYKIQLNCSVVIFPPAILVYPVSGSQTTTAIMHYYETDIG